MNMRNRCRVFAAKSSEKEVIGIAKVVSGQVVAGSLILILSILYSLLIDW
jgi:hypothetical protein